MEPASPVPIAQYGTVAITAWTQVFSAIDILLLKRVTYEEHVAWVSKRNQDRGRDNNEKVKPIRDSGTGNKQGTPTPRQGSIWEAMYFAICLPNNTRLLGTKWQISSVYNFYNFYNCSGPIPPPSRAKFLRVRACTLISSLLVGAVCLVYMIAPCSNSSSSWLPIPSRATLATVLQQTPSELPHPASLTKPPGVQFYLYALFIGSVFLLHKVGYTFYSLVAVGCHLSPPEHWPPFYGAASEAWTVRRFWGNFWHQIFRSFLDSNANFIVSLLGLRRQSLVCRYMRYTIGFFISGFLHLTLDHALGIRGPELLGAMIAYLLQPIAFAIEDLVGVIFQKYSSGKAGETKDRETFRRRRKLIGYIWVAAFIFWSWRFWGFILLKRVLLVDGQVGG